MTMQELLNSLPQTGRVEWIGLRPERGAELVAVPAVEVNTETGLVGDHYRGASGKRHVTLIQQEHLEAVAKLLGRTEPVDPHLTRRNIVVSGINLQAFRKRRFRIGEVILEMSDDCDPCSRMERNLGPGGYNAMRGHGGICARVIQGGRINVGDEVALVVAAALGSGAAT